MKTLYIDNEFRCHVADDGTMEQIETDAFDGMCDIAIECYIYVPAGREYHGAVCTDGFIQCFDSKTADTVQKQYAADNEIVGILTWEVEIDDEA